MPPEILVGIYGGLPSEDIRQLMTVNRQFREELAPGVWRALIYRDVPAVLFDKRELPDGNSAMRPVYKNDDVPVAQLVIVRYEDRVHPELRAILDEFEQTDWKSAGAETMFRLYERILRTTARAMATEFVNAVDFVRRDLLALTRADDDFQFINPPGLDRMGYIGMAHYEGPVATITDVSEAMANEKDSGSPLWSETLWRLFPVGNNQASLEFVPFVKTGVGNLPAAIITRLRNQTQGQSWQTFRKSLLTNDDSGRLYTKNDMWRPAYLWFLHILLKVEASAVLKLSTQYGRDYHSSSENGVRFYYRSSYHREINATGNKNWHGSHSYMDRYLHAIYLGLPTGNTRLTDRERGSDQRGTWLYDL